MITIKKYLASVSTALLLIVAMPPDVLMADCADEEGPFKKFAECLEKCIYTTPPWTIDRAVCGTDCYVFFISDVIEVFADSIKG